MPPTSTPAISSTASTADKLPIHYRYGGLRFAAAEELDQLRVETGGLPPPALTFDLRVRHDRAPDGDAVLVRLGGRYGLTLGTIDGDWLMVSAFGGAFRIDMTGNAIDCFVADVCGTAWLDVFMRRVAPRIAILAGACALHGAAVATREGAALLLGASGAGKSTLSASLARAGWDILSDDVSLLWSGPTPNAAPATTGVCLWPDSRVALGLDEASCIAMPGYEGKMRFSSGHDLTVAPVPLKAVLFLSRSAAAKAPVIAPVPAAAAMVRAAQHRVRFNPADMTGDETRATFQRLGEIMRATPCYDLSYPDGFAALDAVAGCLDAVVRQ